MSAVRSSHGSDKFVHVDNRVRQRKKMSQLHTAVCTSMANHTYRREQEDIRMS